MFTLISKQCKDTFLHNSQGMASHAVSNNQLK